MKLAGCFNDTKTAYMPKHQVQLDLSTHDTFKSLIKKNMLSEPFKLE